MKMNLNKRAERAAWRQLQEKERQRNKDATLRGRENEQGGRGGGEAQALSYTPKIAAVNNDRFQSDFHSLFYARVFFSAVLVFSTFVA